MVAPVSIPGPPGILREGEVHDQTQVVRAVRRDPDDARGSVADSRRVGTNRPTEPASTAAATEATEPTGDSSAAVETGQPSVAEAAPAEPGSGEGLTIGYLSNLESVPIVHVISEGIREQAEIAGVNLLFCDGAGDNATGLDCMRMFRDQGAQGVLNFQHDVEAAPSMCEAGPQTFPRSPSTSLSLRVRPPSWVSTTPMAAASPGMCSVSTSPTTSTVSTTPGCRSNNP